MKKKILMTFTLVPFPLRAHGLSVRYLPIIQYLSRFHDIDLIVINGNAAELCHVDGLREYCRKITVLPDPRCNPHRMFSKGRTYANFLLPWTPPLSMVAHSGSMVTRGVVEATKGEHYDVVVWVGADLLPHLMDGLPSISAGKVFVDFIDSPSLWGARGGGSTFRFGPLARYEHWKTLEWERKVIEEVEATIYISRVDAETVPPRPAPLAKRHVIPNGINIPSFLSAEKIALPSPNIGFLGNMFYPPNVEAVEWLYDEVLTPLRKNHPDLTLVVIGRDPDTSIRNLGGRPGVIVTGTVEDIWPYIHSIDVFLFPLHRGAGVKNKILEAMFAGRPVVTTEIGNEGIDGVDGRDLVLCRTPEDFQREAMRLLGAPGERARMGASAHAFVKEKFSWDRILRAYENLVLGRLPEDGQERLNGGDLLPGAGGRH
jgi:glycosyltransferase involved in cell wall biosynthesis